MYSIEMKKLMRSAIIVVIIVMISKLMGLLREVLIAQRFGTSSIVDAYVVSSTLPTVLFTIFASGFSNAYATVYFRIKDIHKRSIFFSNTINILFLCSLLISTLCYIFSEYIVNIFAPGFDRTTFILTNNFIKIVVWYLPLYTIFNILIAQLYTAEDYIIANFSNFIIANLIVIISIILTNVNYPNMLIFGYVASIFFALLILSLYFIHTKYIHYSFVFQPRDASFHELCLVAIPLGLSLFINQINSVIDRMFASALGEGIMSVLNYANKIQLLPYSAIISVCLLVNNTRISSAFAKGDSQRGEIYTKNAVMIASYVSIPLMLILIVARTPIISILLERGQFSSAATQLTATALAYYAIGIPFYAYREINTYVLIANLKKYLIVKNTIITVLFNIVLNFILVDYIGYKGLALATSISGAIACFLMHHSIFASLNMNIISRNELLECLKICVSSMIALGAYRISCFLLATITSNEDIVIVMGVAVFTLIYVSVSYLLHIKIIHELYRQFINKI